MRTKAEEQLETQGAELDEARAELMTAQTEMARLKAAFSKYQKDALMEVSRLQARAEDAERKAVKATEEVATTKIVAFSEYQSSAEFEQVCVDNYDEGVWAFMYNVWCEHPEWDLSFLREAAGVMIAEFNAPLETPLNDPSTEFVPLPTSIHRSQTSPHRSSMRTFLLLMPAVVAELMRMTRWSRLTILLGSRALETILLAI